MATRLEPLSKVLISLTTVFVLINLMGSLIFLAQPDLLWMQGWKNPDEQQRLVAELAAAEGILTSKVGQTPSLLITGLSTAREGIDNTLVAEALGLRVLNLGSSGGSFQELDYYTRCLDHTKLRPSVIVLGVHASWFAGRIPPSSSPAFDRGPSSKWGRWKKKIFLLSQFRRIHNTLQNTLLAGREWLDDFMGFDLGVHQALLPLDPFKTTHIYADDRAGLAFVAEQAEGFRSLGWFDPERYASPKEQIAVFRRIMARFHRISPRVVVVLMPESKSFRNRTPPAATETLFRSLGEAQSDVLDARAILPESAFYDLVHVNQKGRIRLTRWLAFRLPANGSDLK